MGRLFCVFPFLSAFFRAKYFARIGLITTFAAQNKNNRLVMGVIVKQKTTHVRTNEGMTLARRVTTVRMPNGKYRYPVDYYDATPGAVRVSSSELENLRIPTYKQLI